MVLTFRKKCGILNVRKLLKETRKGGSVVSKEIDFAVLRSLDGFVMSECEYRYMLDCIAIGDYVESQTMGRQGVVKRITRNDQYIPVCVKILKQDGTYDYISMDRIDVWKPICKYNVDVNEYGS